MKTILVTGGAGYIGSHAVRAPCRAGDPPVLVASAEKARRELGWQPRYPELQRILEHAWAWHQRLHQS